MSEQRAPNGSFWSTLPGTLKALAAIIAAVGGLLTALVLAGVIGPDSTTTTTTLRTTTTTLPPTTTMTVEPTTTTTEAEREALVIDLLAFNEDDWVPVETYRPGPDRILLGDTKKIWGGTIVYEWALDPKTGEDSNGIDSWIFYREQCWDPAERGAIASITFTVGRKMIYARDTTGNNLDSKFVGERFGLATLRELMERISDPTAPVRIYFPEAQEPFNNTDWALTETLRLGAEDFEASDGSGPPDFSEGGEELCFGLLRSISNQSTLVGIEVSHELDNFSVTVTPAGS